MDTVAVILDGLRIVFGFFLLLFLPGFNLSLIFFPRSSDLSIIDRLVYSTVLSISSVIALVLFMDVVLGVNTTPGNITLFICVFSECALILWWGERWYLNSRFKSRLEPRLTADYHTVQRFYTRELNAARDRFREDTRTIVVYHEHQQSGLNHIDHSYLMDIGEEIDIQQVIENKLKVTESSIVQPPYPRTSYFELVIREYKEDRLSLVDDLQIYPVLVTRKPDRKVLGFIKRRGSTHIAERIYTKTNMTEIQWIYSHDFHIFGITHSDDTLGMMVDRIMGKLDEIAISLKKGVHISSHAEERQILRDAFDAVIEKPRGIPARPFEFSPLPEDLCTAEPEEIPKRPVVQPGMETRQTPERYKSLTGVEPKEIPKRPVVQPGMETRQTPERYKSLTGVEPKEIPKRPVIQPGLEPRQTPEHHKSLTGVEPKEIPKRPVVQPGLEPRQTPDRHKSLTGVEPKEIPKRPVIQPGLEPRQTPDRHKSLTGVEPKEIPKRPVIQPGLEPRQTPDRHKSLTGVEPKEIPKRPVIQPGLEPRQTPDRHKSLTGVEPKEIPKRPVVQPGLEPRRIPEHQKVLTDFEQNEIPKRPEFKVGIEPVRKLQKDILRDMDTFHITPDSFSRSEKNIENIQIPEAADVKKKLAEIKEDKEIDWLDLAWLYED